MISWLSGMHDSIPFPETEDDAKAIPVHQSRTAVHLFVKPGPAPAPRLVLPDRRIEIDVAQVDDIRNLLL
jgi:hypothetical protein